VGEGGPCPLNEADDLLGILHTGADFDPAGGVHPEGASDPDGVGHVVGVEAARQEDWKVEPGSRPGPTPIEALSGPAVEDRIISVEQKGRNGISPEVKMCFNVSHPNALENRKTHRSAFGGVLFTVKLNGVKTALAGHAADT
jgi:hypothetical protein